MDINHTAPAFPVHQSKIMGVLKLFSLRKNRRSNCPCIIRFTVAAFPANYVEVNFSSVVAVVAQNPHLLVSVFLRHHGCFNLRQGNVLSS